MKGRLNIERRKQTWALKGFLTSSGEISLFSYDFGISADEAARSASVVGVCVGAGKLK